MQASEKGALPHLESCQVVVQSMADQHSVAIDEVAQLALGASNRQQQQQQQQPVLLQQLCMQ